MPLIRMQIWEEEALPPPLISGGGNPLPPKLHLSKECKCALVFQQKYRIRLLLLGAHHARKLWGPGMISKNSIGA